MHKKDTFFTHFTELIQETGAFIRKEAKSFSVDKVEKKGWNDLVSYVDKTAEDMLIKGCSQLIPGAGFIGEETGTKKGSNEYTWIIDPLDGTTNFVHGLPPYSISVALHKGEEAIMGCVYELNLLEMFTAFTGEGAYMNGKPISVTSTSEISSSLLVTGFPYGSTYDRLDDLLAVFKAFIQQSQAIRRLGSAAVDLAYVACGRFDGFYEMDLKPWDVAAGSIIVKEAGGTVTDLQNGSNYLFGRQIVASNAHIHQEMIRILDVM